MAFNPSGRKIGKELVTKLESRIRDLQAENKTLQRQIHDARSGADVRNKYLGEIQYRSRQRRWNKQKLISAFYWVRISQYIVTILAIIVGTYVRVPTVASQSIFDRFPKEFRYYLVWKINDKWCSFPGRKIRHIYSRRRSYTDRLRTVFLPESRSVVYDRL
jgi:hypothetical protein